MIIITGDGLLSGRSVVHSESMLYENINRTQQHVIHISKLPSTPGPGQLIPLILPYEIKILHLTACSPLILDGSANLSISLQRPR